jgi:hypothetical protein
MAFLQGISHESFNDRITRTPHNQLGKSAIEPFIFACGIFCDTNKIS